MRRIWFFILLPVLLSGCSKPYRITYDLENHFESAKTCVIGDIVDKFPQGAEASRKPTTEEVAKFRDYLTEEINKCEFLKLQQQGTKAADYELRVSILRYERGSGAERFMFIPVEMGKAECLVHFQLVDNRTGKTVFAGNFRRETDNPFISGIKVFRRVSEDFCEQLEKRLEKRRKESERAGTG